MGSTIVPLDRSLPSSYSLCIVIIPVSNGLAVLVANCHKQTLELENDYGVPFPVYVV